MEDPAAQAVAGPERPARAAVRGRKVHGLRVRERKLLALKVQARKELEHRVLERRALADRDREHRDLTWLTCSSGCQSFRLMI